MSSIWVLSVLNLMRSLLWCPDRVLLIAVRVRPYSPAALSSVIKCAECCLAWSRGFWGPLAGQLPPAGCRDQDQAGCLDRDFAGLVPAASHWATHRRPVGHITKVALAMHLDGDKDALAAYLAGEKALSQYLTPSEIERCREIANGPRL